MNIGGKNGTLQHSASGGEAVDKNGRVPYTDFNKLQKNRKKVKNGRRPGLSPADYIRRLRLSRSALRLRDEGGRIVDAAMDLGFGSVNGYQRAFFREFGCNPKEYARHPVPLYLFTPYGAKFRNQERCEKEMKEVKTVFVQMVEKPERKVILKRGQRVNDYWEYCQEVGCDV